MERKTWVMPMTLVQKFEANETVAATQCFAIKCVQNTYRSQWNPAFDYNTVSNAPENPWHQSESTGIPGFNHEGTCHTNPEKNIFQVDGSSIVFISEDGLPGGLDAWIDVDNNDTVNEGDRIYWHTDGKMGLQSATWNHWGEVASVDPSRPLHS